MSGPVKFVDYKITGVNEYCKDPTRSKARLEKRKHLRRMSTPHGIFCYEKREEVMRQMMADPRWPAEKKLARGSQGFFLQYTKEVVWPKLTVADFDDLHQRANENRAALDKAVRSWKGMKPRSTGGKRGGGSGRGNSAVPPGWKFVAAKDGHRSYYLHKQSMVMTPRIMKVAQLNEHGEADLADGFYAVAAKKAGGAKAKAAAPKAGAKRAREEEPEPEEEEEEEEESDGGDEEEDEEEEEEEEEPAPPPRKMARKPPPPVEEEEDEDEEEEEEEEEPMVLPPLPVARKAPAAADDDEPEMEDE